MLQIKNLTKIYKPKSGPEVVALNNVSLDFQKNGLVFLLGKSGSGKSTLLNLLGGLDSATDGEIIIKNKSSKDFKASDFDSYRNTYIGFIFQEFNILEESSVAKNIGLALELQGKKADAVTVGKILSAVDLDGYGDRKPNELSGGQKQRVAIARALIKEPDIILADEPTGSLDSNTGRQIFETLKKLSRDKLVIVVSHDRENAEKYADRIIELMDGRVIDDVSRVETGEGAEGIRFYDNMVYIRSGYSLTEQDTAEINSRLKKKASDVVISFDDSVNSKIAPEVKKEAGGKRYEKTDEENIRKSARDAGAFKLIKSRYPYKDSLKMGASGLKYKKIRLVFTILLSFIAFAMFGLSDTMAAFDAVKTTAATIIDNDIEMISLGKESGYSYDGKIYWNSNGNMPLTSGDLNWIKDNFGENYYERIEANVYLYSQLRDLDYSSYDKLTSVSGVMKISSENDLNHLSLTLVAGSLPGANEILVTDFIAETFVEYNYCLSKYYGGGYLQDEEGNIIPGEGYELDEYGNIVPVDDYAGSADIDSYEDLIGKELYLNQNNMNTGYKISGVVKTSYNRNELLETLKKAKMQNIHNYAQYDLIATVFAGSGVYNALKEYSYGSRIFVKFSGNRLQLEQLIRDANERVEKNPDYAENYYTRLAVNSVYSDIISTFDQLVEVLGKVFFYMSLVFSLFSMLLFMNFIGVSIANKRKEIGILRAIGARSLDVYGIFFNESMIIALINLALAVAATFVGASVFNTQLGLSLMVVGIRQIGFMALIAFGVAALGSFLPVYRFAKKKPIETINNR